MNNTQRQSILTSLFIYAGFAVGAFNVLVLFPNEAYFTTEQFGLTRVFTDLAIAMAILCNFGSVAIFYKFFPYYQHYEGERNDLLMRVVRRTLIGLGVIFLGLLIFREPIQRIFSKDNSLFSEYYLLLLPFVASAAAFNIVEALSINLRRADLSSLFKEIIVRLATTLLILLFISGILGYSSFLALFCILFGIAAIALYWVLKRSHAFGFRRAYSRTSQRLKKRINIFGNYSMAGSVIPILAQNVDTFLIAGTLGLRSTAIFSVAAYIGNIVEVPKRSIINVFIPLIARAWKNKDRAELLSIYQKTSIILLLASLFITLMIWLNIDDLFNWIGLSAQYQSGKYIILILAFAKIVDAGTGSNHEILANSDLWKLNFISLMVLILLSIPVNYYFILQYGIIGSAYTQLAAMILYNTMRLGILYWKFRMQPFTLKTLVLLLIAGAVYLLVSAVPFAFSPFWNLVLRSLLIVSTFTGAIFLCRISGEVNNLIRGLFQKLMPKPR